MGLETRPLLTKNFAGGAASSRASPGRTERYRGSSADGSAGRARCDAYHRGHARRHRRRATPNIKLALVRDGRGRRRPPRPTRRARDRDGSRRRIDGCLATRRRRRLADVSAIVEPSSVVPRGDRAATEADRPRARGVRLLLARRATIPIEIRVDNPDEVGDDRLINASPRCVSTARRRSWSTWARPRRSTWWTRTARSSVVPSRRAGLGLEALARGPRSCRAFRSSCRTGHRPRHGRGHAERRRHRPPGLVDVLIARSRSSPSGRCGPATPGDPAPAACRPRPGRRRSRRRRHRPVPDPRGSGASCTRRSGSGVRLGRPGVSGPLDGRLILLGVTGSIAAYKAAELLRALTRRGADVQVLMTQTAQAFLGPLTLADADPTPVDDRPARAAARPAHRAHRRRRHGRRRSSSRRRRRAGWRRWPAGWPTTS